MSVRIPAWLKIDIWSKPAIRPPPSPWRRRIARAFGALVLLLLIWFAVWRVLLHREVEQRLARIRAAGLPTSGAEINEWYPAVPAKENAALVLTQAFALWRTYPDGRSNEIARFKPPPRGQLLSPEQRTLLGGYVQLNAQALARAREGSALPKCRYPVDYSAGVDTRLPHLAKLKALGLAARDEGLLAIESGRTPEVTRAISTMLDFARTVEQEPDVIAQLVRVALVRMATSTLEHALTSSSLSDDKLSQLQSDFASGEKTGLMARALAADRGMFIPYFRLSWAELERFSQLDESGNTVTSGAPLPGRQPLLYRVTGFFERDLNFYLRAMETNIALASLPAPRSLAATNSIESQSREARRRFCIMSSMFLPALGKVVSREAEGFAWLRIAGAALAAKRFHLSQGRWPDNLGELVPQYLPELPVDPFDGLALRYWLLATGYVVFSVGSVVLDDGGREPPERKKSTDTSTYDITFTVER